MNEFMSIEAKFLVLILFVLVLPVFFYAYMMRKRAIWKQSIRRPSPGQPTVSS